MSVARFRSARRKQRCPICGRPSRRAYRPFCSARCADVDLGRWLEGRYRIPAEEPPDGRDEPGEEASASDVGGSEDTGED
ncbi:MAG: DNA gyrase inhibitor YacG [Alphaproteobacteria bacterium]